MENSFFALLFRLKYINRWGLMRNFRTENVAEHSLEVAFLTHALAQIGNVYFGKGYDCGTLVMLAMYHDISEIFTGDMPSPIKYRNNEMRDVYKKIEAESLDSFYLKLPEELREKYAAATLPEKSVDGSELVHAADKLAAYIKCLDEESSGNAEFSRAKRELYKTLDNSDVIELKYFMEHFLPPFSLTVDEI